MNTQTIPRISWLGAVVLITSAWTTVIVSVTLFAFMYAAPSATWPRTLNLEDLVLTAPFTGLIGIVCGLWHIIRRREHRAWIALTLLLTCLTGGTVTLIALAFMSGDALGPF
ncbi:MAG: hypothetical protein ACI841_000348 [Planctomycetota bacterium]|jgi:hypothetical protein